MKSQSKKIKITDDHKKYIVFIKAPAPDNGWFIDDEQPWKGSEIREAIKMGLTIKAISYEDAKKYSRKIII